MPSGTSSIRSGGHGSREGEAASKRGLLAAPNEVIKTIRGSTDDLAWPAATAMFTATADILPDKHAVNESKVPTVVPEGPYQWRKKGRKCVCVCEMTDSSPWAPAGVRVTQRDSQRGVLETCQDQETEASWQLEPTDTHTHAHTHFLIAPQTAKGKRACVWWSASPGPRLSPRGFGPKTRRTPPRLFCWCLLQLHPTADVVRVETGSTLQGSGVTTGRLMDVL